MPVYAIGIIPLLKIIKPKTPEDITMKHVAFAGELLELRRWWDTIDPCWDITQTRQSRGWS